MKRTILFSTILAVLLAGCTMVEPNTLQGAGDEGLVKFTANTATSKVSIAVGEQTPVLAWEAGDQVGIFDLAEDGSRNYCYNVTPAEDATLCNLLPNSAQKAYYGTHEEQTFYAYYPYDAEASEMACEFPVALSRVQTQSESGDIQHLKELNFMAAQTTITDGDAANLEFESIFAFVRFDVLLKEEYDVNIKQLRLKSTATPLAMASGTIDLTDGYILPVEANNDITLAVEDYLVINNTTAQQGYMMVLPGSHAEGELLVEVVAIDNSVATVALPAVTFKANGYYERVVEVSVDDFVQGEPFDIAAESLTGTVGEPVVFSISGVADSIGCYTGEEGHDYDFRNTDRYIYDKELLMSFVSAYASGNQYSVHDDLLKLKVSSDFSGVYTEEEILAATWTDITELVELPETTVKNWYENTKESGEVNLTPYLPDNKTIHIAFFYHVEPYDSTLNNGRVVAYILDFFVTSRSESGEDTAIISDTVEGTGEINLVVGESYEDDPKHPEFKKDGTYGYGNYFRLWSDFQPTTDRYAYMVTKAVAPVSQNLGPDTAIVVQSATDQPVSEYSYTFNEAGTYEVVFVAHSVSLTGEAVEEVKTFTITIE